MQSHAEFVAKFSEILNLEENDTRALSIDSKIADLAFWDSIALISLIIFANVQYSREISAESIKRCETVKDIYNLVHG
jgi:acyl carrier protein